MNPENEYLNKLNELNEHLVKNLDKIKLDAVADSAYYALDQFKKSKNKYEFISDRVGISSEYYSDILISFTNSKVEIVKNRYDGTQQLRQNIGLIIIEQLVTMIIFKNYESLGIFRHGIEMELHEKIMNEIHQCIKKYQIKKEIDL